MFETLHHAHAALGGVNGNAHALHATKLNLVAGNTEVYNSYSGGGGNEGGYYSHVDGHVSPWSPDYSTRPIGPAGLAAEGGPSGDTFACDNDGFGCFVYNRQAFDNILSDSLNTPALDDGGLAAVYSKGAGLPNSATYRIYTDFGTGAESKHAHQVIQPTGPIVYGTNKPGVAKAAPSKGSCPKWADCTGTGSFHVDA